MLNLKGVTPEELANALYDSETDLMAHPALALFILDKSTRDTSQADGATHELELLLVNHLYEAQLDEGETEDQLRVWFEACLTQAHEHLGVGGL